MFEFNSLIIHVDPRNSEADYSTLPDADLIFITHEHGDHYNLDALNQIKKESTLMICTQTVKNLGTYSGDMTVVDNGDDTTFIGIPVEAVPAYNHTLSYHPKGVGNGYIFTFGQKRVYVAGDTEDIPEMDSIEVNIAFIPMNQPYTMTVPQAVNAALMIEPDILYVYHFGSSDTAQLRSQLGTHDNIEVRMGESVYAEYTGMATGSTLLKKEMKPLIYPLPAKGTLKVENKDPVVRAAIYNMDSKLISQVTPGKSTFEYPVDNLSPGTYFLKIETINDMSVSKFIKY
jgi:L-ascorbate metabolism protein UlaG (beta-lactamase superfamily)